MRPSDNTCKLLQEEKGYQTTLTMSATPPLSPLSLALSPLLTLPRSPSLTLSPSLPLPRFTLAHHQLGVCPHSCLRHETTRKRVFIQIEFIQTFIETFEFLEPYSRPGGVND